MGSLGKLLSTRKARVASAIASCNSYVVSCFSGKLPCAFLTRRTYANHEPIVNCWYLAIKRFFGFLFALFPFDYFRWVNICDAFSSLRFSTYRSRELRLV